MRVQTMGCVIKEEGTPVLWVKLPDGGAYGRHSSDVAFVSAIERQRMAVALGRVVAHEIVHAVAAALRHAREGLLRAELTCPYLLGGRLRLDRDSAVGLLPALALRREP